MKRQSVNYPKLNRKKRLEKVMDRASINVVYFQYPRIHVIGVLREQITKII